jgi:glyceraldehyde-3-phosphate dehydrogenase (NADP+)
MNEISLAEIFPHPATIPEQHRWPGPIEQRCCLCAGELRAWSGPVRDVWSPIHLPGSSLAAAAGAAAELPPAPADAGALQPLRLGSYPLMGEKEAQAALAAACQAYGQGLGEWPALGVAERIARVEQLVERMRAARSLVVRGLIWEIGKSYAEAEMEFARTLEYIGATIAELRRREQRQAEVVSEHGFLARFRRAPLGVALCLGPYNNPFYETFTILVPALLMGNTVIFKPPRLGVLLHCPLLEAFAEIFPPGVVNTLYGEGEEILAPLMKSGRIDILAFIGSRRVADLLRQWHPQPRRLRCLLGLEAKNAAIVLADADLDRTVAECALGALAFNGQRCTALKMVFVHETLRVPFLEKLAELVDRLPAGMPWTPGVRITPLPEPARVAYLNDLLSDALAKGARIINEGGGRVNQTFMTPTVLYPVDQSMRLYHEEQFGPLIPVAGFSDAVQPLGYVEQSEFGQQVSIFGQDEREIIALARPLLNQVARININCKCQRGPDSFPFTARKNSAEGTMAVAATLDAFSLSSLVAGKADAGTRRVLAGLFPA